MSLKAALNACGPLARLFVLGFSKLPRPKQNQAVLPAAKWNAPRKERTDRNLHAGASEDARPLLRLGGHPILRPADLPEFPDVTHYSPCHQLTRSAAS